MKTMEYRTFWDSASVSVAGVVGVVIMLIIALIALVLAVLIWWKICSKAGYPGAMGLLMLVPIANIVLLFIMAFGKWPVLRELEHLKQLHRSSQT